MKSDWTANSPSLSYETEARLHAICCRFEDAWKADQKPSIEQYLGEERQPERSMLLRELLLCELEYRRRSGELPTSHEYEHRFPEHSEVVSDVFHDIGPMSEVARTISTAGNKDPQFSTDRAGRDHQAEKQRRQRTPKSIGRYSVKKLLGEGGFGSVYLAYDGRLQREVAIKVPRGERMTGPAEVEAYLQEARILASLDHPAIVPVHDVGKTDDGACYVVSKYIEGRDLEDWIADERLSHAASASLMATVADALHYAHKKKLVHRDIKPANILIDAAGNPFVADFGLALKDEDYGIGARMAGTPAYMSPEQARGEGHLVDGRSDIFSLGVVFYELLTGELPFKGNSCEELIERIQTVDVRPPRQIDDGVPAELERICLKALAKRAIDRYTTAFDVADDLRHWQQHDDRFPEQPSASPRAVATRNAANQPATVADAQLATTQTKQAAAPTVIPKGLRPYDATDADFFLQLLPGPHDRNGLPESVRFWKTRIEPTEADSTFAVGLIYGPSGCGKSSLVSAGILPRLSRNVHAVTVEATADHTEGRLLQALRKVCPHLSAEFDLAETVRAIRRGQGPASGQKILIVLDQFEQWLHAHHEMNGSELVRAVRQCDGQRVQCLILARDDFWLAITRFMQEVDCDLIRGLNMGMVDLFDRPHALKVFTEFGRCYGALPAASDAIPHEQQKFLDQAVDGLASDHKVIPVQLALFSEMVKGRPWVPATLKQLGGITGVGVTFLDESFSSRTANPKHRVHQAAVRRVLNTLLPADASTIRGRTRSYAELLEASGYAQRPSNFTDLIQILDGETRLITPVDLDDAQAEPARAADRSFQLTHDFLVPPLRDWLTRQQRATRQGRAELRLTERASTWQASPINKHLPALWEFLTICVLTRRVGWNKAQREMMRKAGKVYTARAVVLTLVVLMSAWGTLQLRGRLRSESLVESLRRADTREVPPIVNELSRYRRWANPRLQEMARTADIGSKQRLHASLALLSVDSSQVSRLRGSLLEATPGEFPVLRDALVDHEAQLLEPLWNVLRNNKETASRRFLAACSLATYDPAGDSAEARDWAPVAPFITSELIEAIGRNQSQYTIWTGALEPIKDRLCEPLASIYRDEQQRASDRDLAVNILADYVADRPDDLADLLMDADARQFAVLFAKLERHSETAVNQLHERLDITITDDEAGDELARRQATAAVGLLRLGRPHDVWPLLSQTPDLRRRTYLIHGLHRFGAEFDSLVERLRDDPEVSIRRALILSLAPYVGDLPQRQRDALRDRLLNVFRDDPDPGVHSAAEWLLRHVGFEDEINMAQQSMATGDLIQNRRWYVNGQGHTMAVLRGPVEFSMGSPASEAAREEDEELWTARIDHDYAIATHEVTAEQFLRFKPDFDHEAMDRSPDSTCPVPGVLWYDAIAYCNWLSRKEGIDEREHCYYYDDSDPREVKAGTVPDFLLKTGYRLPTEVEWEFACRAGATTSRFYGQSDELLREYAWLEANSQGRTWPVGLLKPNDFGLFDVFGNVYEWCQDRYGEYDVAADVVSVEPATTADRRRVMRGGSFVDGFPFARAANRYRQLPETRRAVSGFRVARTE